MKKTSLKRCHKSAIVGPWILYYFYMNVTQSSSTFIHNRAILLQQNTNHIIQKRHYSRIQNTFLDVQNSDYEVPLITEQKEEGPTSASSHVCVLASENVKRNEIAMSISKELSLPLLYSPIDTQRHHDEDNKRAFSTVSVDQSSNLESFRYCVFIAPYSNYYIDTYAITIQPLLHHGMTDTRKRKKKKKKRMDNKIFAEDPFYVEFSPNLKTPLGSRMRNRPNKNELLLKATALGGQKYEGVVYDLTAGFGRDSLIMALGGASKVYMVEKDPLISLMVRDALRRLQLISCTQEREDDEVIWKYAKELAEKMVLHQEDSIVFTKSLRSKLLASGSITSKIRLPDVCYLDPMFPPRTKSAAVKKHMRLLQSLSKLNPIKDDDNEKKHIE